MSERRCVALFIVLFVICLTQGVTFKLLYDLTSAVERESVLGALLEDCRLGLTRSPKSETWAGEPQPRCLFTIEPQLWVIDVNCNGLKEETERLWDQRNDRIVEPPQRKVRPG